MAITEDEVVWAFRLWNGLAEGGRWVVPDLGIYERTGEATLSLKELYAARPDHIVNEDNRSLFDTHDYLVALGTEVGWEIVLDIGKAYNQEGDVLNIPEDRYGQAAVCSKQCGAIVRIEPPEPAKIFVQINKGLCPVCGEKGFTKSWEGLHVYLDDTGARIKQFMNAEEE